MSENHARLRAFAHYYNKGSAVASDELRDAMDLLRDYDALATKLAEAERLLREVYTMRYLADVRLDDEVASFLGVTVSATQASSGDAVRAALTVSASEVQK